MKKTVLFLYICIILLWFEIGVPVNTSAFFSYSRNSSSQKEENNYRVRSKSLNEIYRVPYQCDYVEYKLFEKSLINQLQAPIYSVLRIDWFRGKEKILEINQSKKSKEILNVKVQVITFQGAHNPPYTEEIITFRFEGNEIKPVDYFNRILPESEYSNYNL
ncbi:hypothetical protein JOC77_003744 [Peribacillus deserti]|uniref:DUF3888 domain-containing protein n=1 Tax=Peribacillus deserti TaxID=673318 RepID=A0ABS2QP78_9BACI|nr:DUF3888 domain-containing protein [Peribacillus deserti]MBM7694283.1 hypothetical protein [Peribacillus deserti]